MAIPRRAFTLIELLAVVLVIAILSGIALGMWGYVNQRTFISTARSQIAAIETALEAYKADFGFYPPTCPCRISYTGFCEATNNLILWRALAGGNGRKQYMRFPSSQLRLNTQSFSNYFNGDLTGVFTNFFDPWGKPYNYFNTPATAYILNNDSFYINNGYTLGGQVNVSSYDVWSYGPDGYPYVPDCVWPVMGKYPYRNPDNATDDLANWK